MTESVQLQVEGRALSAAEEAKGLTVTDQHSLDRAGGVLAAIKALRAEIAATFGPIIDKAHKAHKEAVAQRKKVESPLIAVEATLKRAVAAYTQEQARKAAEVEQVAEEMEEAGLGDLAFREHVPKARTTGVSTSERWHAEVTDFMGLIRTVATGFTPSEALLPNMPYLNKRAVAEHEKLSIPGVKAVRETSVSVK